MKRKLLAFACIIAIMASVFAFTVTAKTPTEDVFRVGYAKVDINPYYTEGAPSSGIMPVPLRGTGSAYKRLAYNGKLDDNGDGKKDQNDGLFLTCIAISDSRNNTVLLFTMDAIGDMGHTALARKEICKKLGAAYGITEDRIMVSGTHAHGGVDLTALGTANLLNVGTAKGVQVLDADGNPILGTEANACLYKWKTRLIEKHFVDAAKKALDDREAATVQKGQIEASTAAEKAMNAVRHYIAPDMHNGGQKYVSGDNFNLRPSQNGSSIYKYEKQVSEVDQTLHAISFSFDNASKAPIVLVNWRGHPSLNSTGSNDRYVTSDYVNAFRYRMEEAGYRPAFFQGAGGNINPTSKIPTSKNTSAGDWIVEDDQGKLKGNTYGSALAEVAQNCLKYYMQPVQAGQIQTMQQVYDAKHVTYSEYEIAAAKAALEANKLSESDPYKWPNTTQNENSIYRWKETPFQYTYVEKETGEEKTICIASISHANKIWDYRNKDENSTQTMEINTLLIGPEIAIVTTPGESFDRYSTEAVLDLDRDIHTANSYNDWDKLNTYNNKTGLGIKNAQYGEPLVFGYANMHVGYIPNYLAYEYNDTHPDIYSTSSYESYMTPLARGEGEKMVAKLADMLNGMVEKEGYCQGCKGNVLWYSLNSFDIEDGHGHYFLTDDLSVTQLELNKGGTTAKTYCLDLNGKTLSSTGRVFYVGKDLSVTLNIMDSSEEQSGKVIGTPNSKNSMSGGTLYIEKGNTLNIYGGTISCKQTAAKPSNGGVIWAKGNVNIYGGVIQGGDAGGHGGTIYLGDENSQLSVYGGTILAGSCGGNGSGYGECVALNPGKVKLAGDAKVEEIIFLKPLAADSFQIVATADKPAFTGNVMFDENYLTDGVLLGSFDAIWDPAAELTIFDGSEIVLTKDNKLVVQAKIGGAAAVVQEDTQTVYQTLEEAISNVDAGYIILGQNVENLVVSKDVVVDLNGKIVENATANNGATLKFKDRKTEDGFVGDHVYGVVKNAYGDVVADENYLALTDAAGTSYHYYRIKLKTVTLRPDKCGVYYKSEFVGDHMIAQQIDTFGVALKLSQEPDEYNMEPGTYSAFPASAFGGENTSTILVDVMKSANDDVDNAEYAQKGIYGRAYIKFKDNTYLFSDTISYSLQELTEIIANKYWADLNADQKNALLGMYHSFGSVMQNWDIENIKTAYAQTLAQG